MLVRVSMHRNMHTCELCMIPVTQAQTQMPADKQKSPQLHLEEHILHLSVPLCACAHAGSHISQVGLQCRSEMMALPIGPYCLLGQSSKIV